MATTHRIRRFIAASVLVGATLGASVPAFGILTSPGQRPREAGISTSPGGRAEGQFARKAGGRPLEYF